MTCPSCGEAALDGATFCEACGAELDAGPSTGPDGREYCVDCGATGDHIDGHGYCGLCGHKQPTPRDHVEIDLERVVAVSDRGRRHHRNEDAVAVAVIDGRAVMIVCDGVSTTDDADAASQAAADAALGVLTASVADRADPAGAMADAAAAAQRAVAGLAGSGGHNPSCTFVAAIVPLQVPRSGAELVVGWLGDSRVYWVGADAVRVTSDHSWASELIAAGTPEADAHAHPRAHTITRWVGADAGDMEPDVVRHPLSGAGMVVVCSDGLWNYAQQASDLAARPELGLASPIERARALVQFANDAGGHDNITVALASIVGTSTARTTRRADGSTDRPPTEEADHG